MFSGKNNNTVVITFKDIEEGESAESFRGDKH